MRLPEKIGDSAPWEFYACVLTFLFLVEHFLELRTVLQMVPNQETRRLLEMLTAWDTLPTFTLPAHQIVECFWLTPLRHMEMPRPPDCGMRMTTAFVPEGCTVGHKSLDLCSHIKYTEARVRTFVANGGHSISPKTTIANAASAGL